MPLTSAFWRTFFVLLCVVSGQLSSCASQTNAVEMTNRTEPLKTFLQRFLRAGDGSEDQSTRYAAAFVDLNGDGSKEVIVYVAGDGWCGSGGCALLILRPTESSFTVITTTSITRLPYPGVGPHDLGVWVQEGGILEGYEAELHFNGTRYPSNPSVPPAIRRSRKTTGTVVISSPNSMQLLY